MASPPCARSSTDGAATVELMDRACLRAWSGKPGAPAYLDELPADATAVLVEYRAAMRRSSKSGWRQPQS